MVESFEDFLMANESEIPILTILTKSVNKLPTNVIRRQASSSGRAGTAIAANGHNMLKRYGMSRSSRAGQQLCRMCLHQPPVQRSSATLPPFPEGSLSFVPSADVDGSVTSYAWKMRGYQES